MSDPNADARRWLADRLGERLDLVPAGGSITGSLLADAVLSADGVEVELRKLARPNGTGFFGYEPTHEQVVIRLPAQPIGETT